MASSASPTKAPPKGRGATLRLEPSSPDTRTHVPEKGQVKVVLSPEAVELLEEGKRNKEESQYPPIISTSRGQSHLTESCESDSEGTGKGGFCAKTTIVHPLMIFVQLLFSGYHVLGSKAINYSPAHREQVALVFALYREVSASLMMALLAYHSCRSSGQSMMIEKRDWPRFFWLGVFSFGNVVGAVEALTLVSATNLAVMQPAIPVFTMGLSVVFRMENLTFFKAVGMAMAVAGAITIEVVKPGNGAGGRSAKEVVLGNIIVVLQCLSMAAVLVFQNTVLTRYKSTVVTAWYYGIGAVLTIFLCIGKLIPAEFYNFEGSTQPWIALSYAAVFGTFFNYNAYSWAGTVISPGTISLYSTLQPIGTALLSVIFLHEKPTTPEILCGILVVAGLLVTAWARRKEEIARMRRRSSSVERSMPLVTNDYSNNRTKEFESYHATTINS